MLQKSLATFGFIALACLAPTLSYGQQVCGLPTHTTTICLGCGTSFSVPWNNDEGEGWNGIPASFPCGVNGGKICIALGYRPGVDCHGTRLQNREIQDELAVLAQSEGLIVADCQGHYHQYRSSSFPPIDLTKLDRDINR